MSWGRGPRCALAATLAVVVVGGCAEKRGDVCTDGAAALARLGTVDLDPGSEDFADVVDDLENVDPPDAIAEDWEAVVDVLVDLRDMENGSSEDVDRVLAKAQELGPRFARVQQHLDTEC